MRTISLLLLLFSVSVCAEQFNVTDEEACMLEALKTAAEDMTIAQLRANCDINALEQQGKLSEIEARIMRNKGIISDRLLREERTQFDPFVLTPHGPNYIMPLYTTNRINLDPYRSIEGYEENLEEIEASFQLSLKVPLLSEDLFLPGDSLYFGFTLNALWQVYSDGISKPFRETNYEPEIFYVAPLDWRPFGGNTGFVLGFAHQSNGRNQLLSRSWDRVYGGLLFEKGRYASIVRPWLRRSEDDKEFAGDPSGDDNPDIEDFMGNFDWLQLYKWEEYEFSLLSRSNPSTHKGAAEFGVTFPLWGKLQGYGHIFTGYGDSLIDFNHKQTRFGLGIALNNF